MGDIAVRSADATHSSDDHTRAGPTSTDQPGTEADALTLAARPIVTTVEALIVASGRPVPARRLAQALGLAPPDGEAPDAQAPAPDAQVEPKPAPRRRRKAEADRPDPESIIRRAVDLLNAEYESTARAFRVEAVAGGYRLMTLPAFGSAIAALQGAVSQSRLSKSAVETLAIIAYRQPVTRAHLEAIRGVACGEVLKTLLDRRLITIAGRAEELGRPLLYATTRQFLAAFGLASIKDLPSAAELGFKQPA
ncbi:MAG: SMC-Scp complex subunit ScpB [Phycisphaerales bacterium]